jgi:hypothetical protein
MTDPQTKSLVIAGVTWFAGGLLYWFGYRPAAYRYAIMREVPTIACKDLPGLGAAMVEVKGVAQADSPLTSDLARVPCVAFASAVTEHWTTTRTETDSKGNTRTVTEHHSASRYSNSREINFQVHDAGGQATVCPKGASMDMLNTLGSFSSPGPDSPAYGVSAQHWNGHLSYHESALPVGQQVYVLGQVSEEQTIGRPADIHRPFIISYRTEETLCRRAAIGKYVTGILCAILLAGGLAALAFGPEF